MVEQEEEPQSPMEEDERVESPFGFGEVTVSPVSTRQSVSIDSLEEELGIFFKSTLLKKTTSNALSYWDSNREVCSVVTKCNTMNMTFRNFRNSTNSLPPSSQFQRRHPALRDFSLRSHSILLDTNATPESI